MRVDLTIRDHTANKCLGIEVKTRDNSAKDGQLLAYQTGLEAKYPDYAIRMVYLTQLNRRQVTSNRPRPQCVADFDRFSKDHPQAIHLSWLDLADICWAGGGQLWEDHRIYVRDVISKPPSDRLGGLDVFFGQEVVNDYENAVASSGLEIGIGDIYLAEIVDATAFIDALRVFIESPVASDSSSKEDKFDPCLRERFLKSKYADIYAGIFALAEEYRWVWLQGKLDYALQVAHPYHVSGVSIRTSVGPNKLRIGRPR